MTALTKYVPIFFLFFFSYSAHAQVDVNRQFVTGKVLNEKKIILNNVSVHLHRLNDSSLVATTLSDNAGEFLFSNIPIEEYFLKLVSIGYQDIAHGPFSVKDRQTYNIGTLVMQSLVQELDVVSITSKKNLIERKDGKVIINVSSSPLAEGNSALEILARVPGITLDNEGSVSLRGKPGVSIMLNGKLTNLSSSQLANLLRATPGSTINTIEVIPNPSAKYDAAGTGGIINIKLKTNNNYGTNGMLMVGGGYGTYRKSQAGVMLNHRSEKINVFADFNYTNNKQFENLSLNRSTKNTSKLTYFNQEAKDVSISKNYGYKAGIDYFINEHDVIGFMTSGYSNNNIGKNKIKTFIGHVPGAIDSTVLGQNVDKSQYKNETYNLNYKFVIDTLGQELNADLDYSIVENKEFTVYNNIVLDAAGHPLRSPNQFRNSMPSNYAMIAGKIDYSYPLNDKTKLETGIKSYFVNIDNKVESETLFDNTWINNENLSNHFSYKESVSAVYFNLHKQLRSSSIQMGLRNEFTHSEGITKTLQERVTRNYIDFFPSLSINLNLSEKNELSLSYNRRIDRPDYQSLNPFTYYSDLYTRSQGNPSLKPQYASSFDIGYEYAKSLNVSFGIIHTKDVMTTTLLTDTIAKTIVLRDQNFDSRSTYIANISKPFNLTNWWSTNNEATIYHSRFFTPDLMGVQFRNEKTTIRLSTIHTFTFNSNLDAELAANYSSSQVYGTYVAAAMYGVDLGLNKSFAGKKAHVKFSINDLFDQRQIKIRSAIPSLDYQLNQKEESRSFRLTLTYNFGNTQLKVKKFRSNNSSIEQERVKSGR